MEAQDNSQWVAERLALVKPAWEPETVKARLLVEERTAPRPRLQGWRLAGGMAALALAVIAVLQGRAIAQEIWFSLFLNRIDLVRVDLSDLPFHTNMSGSGQRAVPGVEEAEAQAGFRPY